MTPMSKADVDTVVAETLFVEPDELTPTTDLADLGLESIRLHSLVEIFRSRGSEVSFTDLAEDLHLSHWYLVLTENRP
ncbi:MAG: phosphopantetheine-binding protein [Rhodococcus sp. (in: high G+C Gram-positive bacteria)]